MFPRSLRQALVLSFVAATVLPISLLGVFSTRYFERKLLETHASLINSHALSISREARELIDDANASLTLVEKTLRSPSALMASAGSPSRKLLMAIRLSPVAP